MEQYEFDHLMKTVPGIGVVAKNRYGETMYFFYEDLPHSKGIERAMDQMYNAKDKGAIQSVSFYENSKRTVHS